jgi:hypothetical protein
MTNFSELRVFPCTAPASMSFNFDRLMGIAERTFNQIRYRGTYFCSSIATAIGSRSCTGIATGFAFGTSDLSVASLKCRPAAERAWSWTSNICRDC